MHLLAGGSTGGGRLYRVRRQARCRHRHHNQTGNHYGNHHRHHHGEHQDHFPGELYLYHYPALHRKSGSGYSHELASYTTYYDAKNETRTANITASIRKLNNLVIPAGRTFSFNQTVGKRTVLAGYATAKVVQDGEFVDGLGGGVCQVSSTIFECILRANLQVVCRAPHSLEISYVPLGGDATVQWNTTDFQFKNTSGTDIRLQMTAKNGTLTCKVMGQKNVKPKDVKISIKKTGKQYVLTRTVGGKVNYTTYSTYAKPKKSQ